MSTVRTIVPRGVAEANQLKLRVSALEMENAELRQRNQQLILMLQGGGALASPVALAPQPALGNGQPALAQPMQDDQPRMLAGATDIPSDVMANMLAQLAT